MAKCAIHFNVGFLKRYKNSKPDNTYFSWNCRNTLSHRFHNSFMAILKFIRAFLSITRLVNLYIYYSDMIRSNQIIKARANVLITWQNLSRIGNNRLYDPQKHSVSYWGAQTFHRSIIWLDWSIKQLENRDIIISEIKCQIFNKSN